MRRWLWLIAVVWLVACGGGENGNAVVDDGAVSVEPAGSPTATLTPPPTITPPSIASPTFTPQATPTEPVPVTVSMEAEPAGSPPDLRYLQAVVDNSLSDFTNDGGVVSYYIQDLASNEVISRDPDIAFAGMSIVKIPILVQTYRVLEGPPNIYHTSLITQTTALSGNYTANLLLSLVSGQDDPYIGTDVVTQELRRMGLYNTFLAAPYDSEQREGRPITYLTPANTRTDLTTRPDPNMQTTTRDMGQLLSWIYACQEDSGPLRELYPDLLTPSDCLNLLTNMALNDIDSLIEAGVPEGVAIAHKHGWIGDTHGDAGIVFSDGGDYVMVIMLYRPEWLEWAISAPLIAEVSRLAYAHFNEPDPYPPNLALPTLPAVTPTTTPDLPRALISGTNGNGVYLRATPGGAEVMVLPEGEVVLLLGETRTDAAGRVWQAVETVRGETGWVVETYLLMD